MFIQSQRCTLFLSYLPLIVCNIYLHVLSISITINFISNDLNWFIGYNNNNISILFDYQLVFISCSDEFVTGLLVNCLQGPAIISMKSILNKIIPAEEIG